MTAGVARTVAAKCLPVRSVDDCATSIRAHPESEAVLWTDSAKCVSACAIAVIGASTREIAPDALLGVHAAFVYVSHPTRGVTERQIEKVIERATKRVGESISSYVDEMNLSKEPFRTIWSTKAEDMHYLTRAELFDLGIDRRESAETGWHFGYQPIPAVGSAAFVNLAGRSEGPSSAYKHLTLIVSCDSRYLGSFLLTSLHGVRNSSAPPTRDLRVSAGSSGVTLTSSGSFLTSYKNETFEVRQQRTARAVVDALMRASAITIAEQSLPSHTPSSEASTAQFGIPGTGGDDALKTLVRHCAPIQPVVAAIAAPPSVKNIFPNVGEAREPAWRFAFLPVAAIGSAAYASVPWTSHPTVLAISCAGYSYTISTVRSLPDSSTLPNSDILIGDESPGISLPATASSTKIWKGDPYDVRQSRLSNAAVEKLLASATITVREKPKIVATNPEAIKVSETKPAQYSIPTKGASEAFKALGNHCAMLN